MVRLLFFLQGVCEKEQDFLSWARVPLLLHCCQSGLLSTDLVNSCFTHTGGETFHILVNSVGHLHEVQFLDYSYELVYTGCFCLK